MVDCIVKILNDILEYIMGCSVTLAIHHPFDIEEDATKISLTDADLFHHFVEQLL